MPAPIPHRVSRFEFHRDTFGYAHGLVWQYRLDPATGEMHTFRTIPPPTYYHHCFVMVRSARQFLYHARFEPGQARVEAPAYRKIIRDVVGRSLRHRSLESERVVVPGYDGLRSFSQGHETLLKAECGSAWESYSLSTHWRMVFPIWGRHQERVARQLRRALHDGSLPLVHLFRFPRITINHGIALFSLTESAREIEFEAYDPNIPGHPVKLHYDLALRRFSFPRTHYFAGGAVSVMEIYRAGLLGFLGLG
jgi:hypothetical protein